MQALQLTMGLLQNIAQYSGWNEKEAHIMGKSGNCNSLPST